MNSAGHLSQLLEREVSDELRKHGIVVWLDAAHRYDGFVDGLIARHEQGAFPYPVVAFRGSFLELLLELAPYGGTLDPQGLLIHMPGFNQTTIRTTPVLELYAAGHQFQKGFDTLVREAALGRATPDQINAVLARGEGFEATELWLDTANAAPTDDLSRFLEDAGPTLVLEALGGVRDALEKRVPNQRVGQLVEYLNKLTGFDQAWLEQHSHLSAGHRLEHVLPAFAAWLLCVEYVADLRRAPYLDSLQRLRQLSKPLVEACRRLVSELRARFAEVYERTADEVEGYVSAELDRMSPEDLGSVDTFRKEEARILEGALDALLAGEWSKAAQWHDEREGDRSFWIQREPMRRFAWILVGEAARFGRELAAHPRPLGGARSLEEAVQRYTSGAYLVDQAHRRFEQRRNELLDPRIEAFGRLQMVVGDLRRRHRAWANQVARDFTEVCRSQGFLPADGLQQRAIFDQVVRPLLAEGGRVAIFMVDALRYEMAAELAKELTSAGTLADLKARLAELPTLTAVGMNALAPVAQNGRLQVAAELRGFKSGEFTVIGPESRARAMGLASVGKAGVLLKLSELVETEAKALKQKLAPHDLVVVHSTEIDDAGEANVGLSTFQDTLRHLAAAWHQLQAAGVRRCVFVADHGFLLQDETTEIKPFGKKTDPCRRHVLDDHPREEPGMVPVSMSSLGYDGIGGFLLLREDTASFATGNPGAGFVHGGNSPQERIIPVLTLSRSRRESRVALDYTIEAKPMDAVLGYHRVGVRLRSTRNKPLGLSFVASPAVALEVRAKDATKVRAILKDAIGPGEIEKGRLLVPESEDWTEVFFALEGPMEEPVRVEVCHPEQLHHIRPLQLDRWFAVIPRHGITEDLPTTPAPTPLSWSDEIDEEAYRKVFLHIEKYESITEAEVTSFLGSPRAFRKFSREFQDHLQKLPFKVRTESGPDGKRYVKDKL